MKCPARNIFFFIISILLLFRAEQSFGIVLHPTYEPNLATWTERPDSNVVGCWRTNASCVAIAPNYIITTKHQGGTLATPVVIGGVTYSIDKIWPHPTADFRVVKLHSANLKSYVDMYTEPNEIGQPIVIGGFGKRRNEEYTNYYTWTTETNNINSPLLFGTNQVDNVGFVDTDTYDSEILVAHFNSPSASLYECTIAEFDSGGGWFIKDNSEWKVAGLSRGLKVVDKSWYTPAFDRNYLDSVRVSAYTDFVSQSITTCDKPTPGDFNGDYIVDNNDLEDFVLYWLDDDCAAENNYCQGSDLELDGDVDLVDFAVFAENWLSSL